MRKEIRDLLKISKIYGFKKGYIYFLTPYKETIIIKNNRFILNEFREDFFKQLEVLKWV